MKLFRLFTCQWDYLPYGPKTTLQIGPLTITNHFPGCSTWGVEISTSRECAIFPAFYAIGEGFEEVHWTRIFRSPWRSVTVRLGKPLITFHLCRESLSRYIRSLERAIVAK